MKVVKTEEKIITTYKHRGVLIKETEQNNEVIEVNVCRNKELNAQPFFINKDDFYSAVKASWYDDIVKIFQKSQKFNSVQDIIGKDVFYFCFDSHTIYDENKNPISIVQKIDYIESIVDLESEKGHEIFLKLSELIENHPYVLYAEFKEIHYYNSDFNGPKGIDALVYIPQEDYNNFYKDFNNARDLNKASRLSIESKDYNIFGEEITSLLKKYWELKYKY